MRDLIPIRIPLNSWRGYALRVAVIALAALIVLGIASLFGWTFDDRPHSPIHTETASPRESSPEP